MANPFKNPTLRKEYEAAVHAYKTRHRNLFVDGKRRGKDGIDYGSGFAEFFWKGYDGIVPLGLGWDRASKQWAAYAHWCAGRDIARSEINHV